MYTSALGREDDLNLVFAETLVAEPGFVAWLLSKTKFASFAQHARVLNEEQAALRKARFWWRHWWCKLPETGADSETDLFLAFEADEGRRFCLHIENKLLGSLFTKDQPRNYNARARHMLNHGKSAALMCSDWTTILMAPRSFLEMNAEGARLFECVIAHEEIAHFIPTFVHDAKVKSGEETALYDILEHTHRFACWAASIAAKRGTGLKVKDGRAILERADLKRLLQGPDHLPRPDEFDEVHRSWRSGVIAAAKECGLEFSHGTAAKMINVYLKAGLLSVTNAFHPSVAALHPPIDRLLLKGLKDRINLPATPWSRFSSCEYELVIAAIRGHLGGKPMWMIEEKWPGYQT